MASSHVEIMAFIPVSEDEGMIEVRQMDISPLINWKL